MHKYYVQCVLAKYAGDLYGVFTVISPKYVLYIYFLGNVNLSLELLQCIRFITRVTIHQIYSVFAKICVQVFR